MLERTDYGLLKWFEQVERMGEEKIIKIMYVRRRQMVEEKTKEWMEK